MIFYKSSYAALIALIVLTFEKYHVNSLCNYQSANSQSRKLKRDFVFGGRPTYVLISLLSMVFGRVFNRGKLITSFLRYYSNMAYSTVEKGSLFSPEYRLYFRDAKGLISPLHDIPLYPGEDKKVVNMVVEIPRWTNAKMEINLAEPLNPIKQDIKKGVPRFVPNCFPHHGYIWNYGALPQTWEDPSVIDENTKSKGDNDPIDALEIGYRIAKRGEVIQVKILGTIALIDEGETDWKVLTIDVNDPIASQVNDIPDVEKHFPGLLKATVEWLKIYKIPDGKPENQFAFNGEPKPSEFAQKIVGEVHQYWKKLVNKEKQVQNIAGVNTTLNNTSTITVSEADVLCAQCPEVKPPQSVNPLVDKWHFIPLKY